MRSPQAFFFFLCLSRVFTGPQRLKRVANYPGGGVLGIWERVIAWLEDDDVGGAAAVAK